MGLAGWIIDHVPALRREVADRVVVAKDEALRERLAGEVVKSVEAALHTDDPERVARHTRRLAEAMEKDAAAKYIGKQRQ